MAPSSPIAARGLADRRTSDGISRNPLAGRLGLSVPYDWWSSAPLLKAYEAAGLAWVQLHSPPEPVLREARESRRHALATRDALATTALRVVVHAPAALRLGDPGSDRAFESLLGYAAELGAEQVVYHALALPDTREAQAPLAAEQRSLAVLAALAERLELTIALENLAPLYPGPETMSATPLAVRGLARRIGSPALRLCLDLGHAHVVADRRHTSIEKLTDPALDLTSVFHLHDNHGARRRRSGEELGVDPLRLDLHLPPGRGSLPWERVAPSLVGHPAPLMLEVHPPYRPRARALSRSLHALLGVPVADA